MKTIEKVSGQEKKASAGEQDVKLIEKIAKGPYMHKGKGKSMGKGYMGKDYKGKDYKHKMKMGKGGMTY